MAKWVYSAVILVVIGGIEYSDQSGGLFNARLILKGTKLYMMIAAFLAASARREEDVNHFFDSFKLMGMRAR